MANETKPEIQVETSKFLTLNWRDLVRGFVIAVIGAALTQIYSVIDSGSLVFNWKAILTGSLVPGVSYLLRNLFESSKTVVKITPPDKQITDGKS